MLTLRQARDLGLMDRFLQQQEDSPLPSDGDEDAFNRALSSMARTSKAVPATSPKALADD